MKPVDVKDNTYNDFKNEVNNESPKFIVGDHEKISIYKIFLLKDTHQVGQKKFL